MVLLPPRREARNLDERPRHAQGLLHMLQVLSPSRNGRVGHEILINEFMRQFKYGLVGLANCKMGLKIWSFTCTRVWTFIQLFSNRDC